MNDLMEDYAKKKIEFYRKELENAGFFKLKDSMKYCLDVIEDNVTNRCGIVGEKVLLYRTYGLSSSQYTCDVLEDLIVKEDFIDVFVLLRKIRDNLMLDCFLISETRFGNIESDSIYNNADLSLEELTPDILVEFIQKIIKTKKIKGEEDIKKAVASFFENELHSSECTRYRKKYYEYDKYKTYFSRKYPSIEKSEYVEKINNMTRELNNYVHGNGARYLTNMRIVKSGFETIVSDIMKLMRNMLAIFVIYIFYIDSTLLQSSDYIDYLDFGCILPDEVQYCVAPVIKNVIAMIKEYSIETYKMMLDDNKYGMKIEC